MLQNGANAWHHCLVVTCLSKKESMVIGFNFSLNALPSQISVLTCYKISNLGGICCVYMELDPLFDLGLKALEFEFFCQN